MGVRGLRDVPYPYTGMLSLCSDIDYCTPKRFKATHRFLNTDVNTGNAGVGVGLDVGDTCFALDPPQTSLIEPGTVAVSTIVNRWNNESEWEAQVLPTRVENAARVNAGAAFVARYMASGWIDALHGGFGAYASPYTYNGVEYPWDGAADGQAWVDFLSSHGLTIDTYLYHSVSQSDINNGPQPNGGTIGATTFWADKLRQGGARFVWAGLTQTLSGRRNLLTPTVIGGEKFWLFPRFNKMNGADNDYYSQGNTVQALLTTALLDELTTVGGLMTLYVHLGNQTPFIAAAATADPIFPAETQVAFRRLRAYQDAGKVLTSRTSRLLRYNHARDNAVWSFDPYRNAIDITDIYDSHTGEHLTPTLDRCRGLTFYVDALPTQSITIAGVHVDEARMLRAPADATGKASVGIRWHPYDRTDYTTTTTPGNVGQLQPASAYAESSTMHAPTRPLVRDIDLKGGIR